MLSQLSYAYAEWLKAPLIDACLGEGIYRHTPSNATAEGVVNS